MAKITFTIFQVNYFVTIPSDVWNDLQLMGMESWNVKWVKGDEEFREDTLGPSCVILTNINMIATTTCENFVQFFSFSVHFLHLFAGSSSVFISVCFITIYFRYSHSFFFYFAFLFLLSISYSFSFFCVFKYFFIFDFA